MIILKSDIDESINFITEKGKGYLESRYVRREKRYFCCYLSSQSGCNRGCGFCHLTTTGQTMFDHATIEDFLKQASHVFNHYDNKEPSTYVHFNEMARGEALCNPTITEDSENLFSSLYHNFCKKRGLIPKYNVSTIIPQTFVTEGKRIVTSFPVVTPSIYYSLYSLKKEFREKWLPGAADPYEAMEQLKEYQKSSKKIIKLHYALIPGENDTEEDTELIGYHLIKKYGLYCELNLVQYNPPNEFSPENKKESQNYEEYRDNMHKYAGNYLMDSKVVTRVGMDVAASCGTFYS